MKPAFLVIDVINDFVHGVLGSDRASGIIPNIQRLLAHARRRGYPVIYITDSHTPDDREFDLWPGHAIEGSHGAQVVPELAPQPGDHHLTKTCYSAFHGTELDELLRGLGVDTVILTGLVTNICIQHAAADAYHRGYRIVVPSDCVQAPTPEEQERALDYMRRIYGAEIVPPNGAVFHES